MVVVVAPFFLLLSLLQLQCLLFRWGRLWCLVIIALMGLGGDVVFAVSQCQGGLRA